MDVNAYTTLNLLEATARGHGWRETGFGTLDVSADDDDGVALEYEFDSTEVDRLPQHAVRIEMSEDEARALLEGLRESIEEVEDG